MRNESRTLGDVSSYQMSKHLFAVLYNSKGYLASICEDRQLVKM